MVNRNTNTNTLYVGVIIGMVIGNGNFTSFAVGALTGWLSSNPQQNMNYIKQKYSDFVLYWNNK